MRQPQLTATLWLQGSKTRPSIWKYLISWTLQAWCTVLSILVNPMPISVLLNAHCIAVHWSTDCIERRKDRRQDGWTCWSGAKSFFPPRLIPIRRKSDWKGIRRRRQRKTTNVDWLWNIDLGSGKKISNYNKRVISESRWIFFFHSLIGLPTREWLGDVKSAPAVGGKEMGTADEMVQLLINRKVSPSFQRRISLPKFPNEVRVVWSQISHFFLFSHIDHWNFQQVADHVWSLSKSASTKPNNHLVM